MKTIEPSEGTPIKRREGVVLYTSDKGSTWSIVYRNPKVKSINSLAAINFSDVTAVGENGLILRIEKSSVTPPGAR